MISDVIVVSADPAGSDLGYLLARRGVSVTILDKARFPREKVCGGGISPRTIALLDFDIGPSVDRRISSAVLTFRNRHSLTRDLPERLSGATVVRAAFDQLLLQRARGRGVQPAVLAAVERGGVKAPRDCEWLLRCGARNVLTKVGK